MALICAVSLNAQEQVTYTEVVDANGKTKDELYDMAKMWFTTTYNSANDVLQMDSKESGTIVGKALFKYIYPKLMGSESVKGTINYTIKLYFKDNKYKYEITDFIHTPYITNTYECSFGLITTDEECDLSISGTKKWKNDVWNNIKIQIGNNMEPLISSLKNGMINKIESSSNDW